MKFKSRAEMKSHPAFKVDTQVEPIAFQSSARCALEGTLGGVSGRIGEIPLHLTIPFLRRKNNPVVASLGGMGFDLSPIKLKIDETLIALDGVIGSKGLRGHAEGSVQCHSELDLSGEACGKAATVSLSLGDEECD